MADRSLWFRGRLLCPGEEALMPLIEEKRKKIYWLRKGVNNRERMCPRKGKSFSETESAVPRPAPRGDRQQCKKQLLRWWPETKRRWNKFSDTFKGKAVCWPAMRWGRWDYGRRGSARSIRQDVMEKRERNAWRSFQTIVFSLFRAYVCWEKKSILLETIQTKNDYLLFLPETANCR